MTNWYHANVLRGLRKLLKEETDPARRTFIKTLIEDMEAGNALNERQIRAAKMIGVRNPFFDGDLIGYPEDDFDE
jgi:hypothetical protein